MDKTLKERNGFYMVGKGELIATVKGTRKYLNDVLIDPGIIVHVQETPNIICNEGLELLAGFIIDESAVYDVGITYCEIGTDNTAPAAGDTTLTAYHARKAVTADSRLLYVATFSTFFTAAEATAAIEEAGVWGGNDAAAGEATGLLFAHWLSSFDNSGGLYDITFNYILTIARA